jgi:hypothetical protein
MIRASAVRSPRRADPPTAWRFLQLRRLRGSISPNTVDAIASAIQTQEGYYPGSLAYQNNNPGNLVYAGQPGATPGAGGFADFSSYAAGYSALQSQITLDATRGTDVNGNPTTTLSQLISSWAPPDDNDTASYIANVSAATGYDPDALLSSLGAPSPLIDTSDDSLSSISADLSSSTVDLSSVGLSSTVPVWGILAGAVGLVAVFALGRR